MKVVFDIQRLHPLALKRGVGFYTENLVKALNNLEDSNEYILSQKRLKNINFDLIHYPFFDPFFLTLPFLKKKPAIVTIHDLTLIKFPKQYQPGLKGKAKFIIQNLSLKNISAVITDSINSKKDILKILRIPENKVHVVYLAADKNFKKLANNKWEVKVREKYHLPNKFILYVGDLN